jgi:AcrR family transcriptional regulator
MAVRQPRQRQSGDERRRTLVTIAYRQIAEKGFEGLRVRDIAAEAAINSATLHYYFPTKEALIQGVVEHLVQEFSTLRVPAPSADTLTPLDELRLEFADARQRLRDTPELFVVLTELYARSLRDPTIARFIRGLENGWHGHLEDILRRGIEAGLFRADLDTAAAAALIMAEQKGIGLGYAAAATDDAAAADRLVVQLAAQVEYWLTARPAERAT